MLEWHAVKQRIAAKAAVAIAEAKAKECAAIAVEPRQSAVIRLFLCARSCVNGPMCCSGSESGRGNASGTLRTVATISTAANTDTATAAEAQAKDATAIAIAAAAKDEEPQVS